MVPIRFLVVFSLCLIVPGAGAIAEDILLGQRGSVLRDNLRRQYTPSNSQSYSAAREAMFSDIDNVDGAVTCVYTGVNYRTVHIPNPERVNTEHTWPQSKFEDGSNSAQMKADLHHLYVTLNEVNAVRGNFPFAEIPDSETRMWWISADGQRNLPSAGIDDYSESIPGAFEPREVHKGNAARSLFYFFTIYEERGINLAWFRPQIVTLLAWHEQDPADDEEIDRTEAIAGVQGNKNPFVLDPTLAGRIFQSTDHPDRPIFGPSFFGTGRVTLPSDGALLGIAKPPVLTKGDKDLVEENRRLKELIGEMQLEISRLKQR